MNEVSLDTQAVLLLTSRLRQSEDASAAPLKPSEYLGVVKVLDELGMSAGSLVDEPNLSRLAEAGSMDSQRLSGLMGRGLALSMAVEKWSAQGIWVMSWSDPDYPAAYKEKLKGQAPPILYGIGDKSLMCNGGVAVVGSREVDEQGVVFARRVAERCADGGAQVVSGAARGVDREAMNACLEHGGKAVGILADSLARHAVSGQLRDAIMNGTLALVSQFEPESHFFVSSAMARNKLIYALADYAVVVSSDVSKGGTWAGANEDLTKGWTPLFARDGEDVPEGNRKLIDLGAIPVDDDTVRSKGLLNWMREAGSGWAPATKQKPSTPAQGSLPLF